MPRRIETGCNVTRRVHVDVVSRPDLRSVLVHLSWSGAQVSRWVRVQDGAALRRSCLRGLRESKGRQQQIVEAASWRQ